MELTYKIANIKIKYSGNANNYFLNNLSAYEVKLHKDEPADIYLHTEIGDIKSAPEGEEIVRYAGKTWLKTEDGFSIYEYIPEIDYYLASINISSDFKNVSARFADVDRDGIAVSTYHDYNLLGFIFEMYMLKNNAMNLHSSAISYKNHGLLFSAPSGTGKSTHAGLWKKYYPDDTVIINDDFPAIKFINDIPYVFGTPWSGKTFINQNTSAPIKAIVFLRQSKTIYIKRLNTAEVLNYMITEIGKYPFEELMYSLLSSVDKLIRSVPIYLLKCDISKESVDGVKNEIFGGTNK